LFLADDVSALSEARFQEKVCTITVLRRAFDKAVRRKAARGCGGRGPYTNAMHDCAYPQICGLLSSEVHWIEWKSDCASHSPYSDLRYCEPKV